MTRLAPNGKRHRYRILVVDDDEGMRENLSELFTSLGYEVLTAANTPEALARIRASEFDLILTDYRMPGPTGIELIESAREIHPGVRAVLMTAFGDTFTEVESARRGASGYITKPFEADAVAEMVKRALASGGR